MARQKSPLRDEAYALWIASNKKIKLKDLATKLGVSDGQIRRWKSLDNWDGKDNESKVTKSNAKRRGAPKGNKNSVKHGGYSSISVDFLSDEEKEMYDDTPEDARDLIIQNIALQKIRERRVFNYIKELNAELEGDSALFKTEAILNAEEALSRIQGNISHSIRILHQMGVDDATIELKRKALDLKYNNDSPSDEEMPDSLSASLASLAEELN